VTGSCEKMGVGGGHIKRGILQLSECVSVCRTVQCFIDLGIVCKFGLTVICSSSLNQITTGDLTCWSVYSYLHCMLLVRIQLPTLYVAGPYTATYTVYCWSVYSYLHCILLVRIQLPTLYISTSFSN
jgi:hypothetical protein